MFQICYKFRKFSLNCIAPTRASHTWTYFKELNISTLNSLKCLLPFLFLSIPNCHLLLFEELVHNEHCSVLFCSVLLYSTLCIYKMSNVYFLKNVFLSIPNCHLLLFEELVHNEHCSVLFCSVLLYSTLCIYKMSNVYFLKNVYIMYLHGLTKSKTKSKTGSWGVGARSAQGGEAPLVYIYGAFHVN